MSSQLEQAERPRDAGVFNRLRPGQNIVRASLLLRKRGEKFTGRHHSDFTLKEIILAFQVDLKEVKDSNPLSETPQ